MEWLLSVLPSPKHPYSASDHLWKCPQVWRRVSCYRSHWLSNWPSCKEVWVKDLFFVCVPREWPPLWFTNLHRQICLQIPYQTVWNVQIIKQGIAIQGSFPPEEEESVHLFSILLSIVGVVLLLQEKVRIEKVVGCFGSDRLPKEENVCPPLSLGFRKPTPNLHYTKALWTPWTLC